jgi:hypothetical protein
MLEIVASGVVLLLMGPLLLIGVVGLLLLGAAILPRGPRRVRETFRCPSAGRVVTADFLVSEGAVHPAQVVSCTAFRDPEQITCTKPCRQFVEAWWGLPRGVFPRWALIAGDVVTWRDAGAPAASGAS